MAAQGVTVNWYPEALKAKLAAHVQQNLDMAAITLADAVVGSFGSSEVSGEKSGATKAQRGANRSTAWGPPNVDTGHLKRNVGYEKPAGNPLVRRVGTGVGNKESVGYAMWLEFGTRKMLPRPFLRPMLHKMRGQIRAILSRPMK